MLEAIMLFLGLLNLWVYYMKDGLKVNLVAGIVCITILAFMTV